MKLRETRPPAPPPAVVVTPVWEIPPPAYHTNYHTDSHKEMDADSEPDSNAPDSEPDHNGLAPVTSIASVHNVASA